MRLLILFFVLTAMVLIPFAIWGDQLTATFSAEGSVAWLRSYGTWAWAMAIVLLIADLFLPIPATVVMAALGIIYGPILGGAIAAGGSFLSGALAYGLCRLGGEKGALWLLGEKDLKRGERIFKNVGGWLVALSRWLPVFPEVIACLAGLNRMKSLPFFLALLSGSLPLGFAYAYIGSMGANDPVLTLILSAGVPPVLWLIIQYVLRKRILSQ